MSQRRRAKPIEVHQQKGKIGSDVNVAQPFAKLDAIDNVDLVSCTDMLAAQVAVPVANHSRGGAPFNQLSIGIDEAAVEKIDTLELRFADGVADEPTAFFQVAIYDFSNCLGGAVSD